MQIHYALNTPYSKYNTVVNTQWCKYTTVWIHYCENTLQCKHTYINLKHSDWNWINKCGTECRNRWWESEWGKGGHFKWQLKKSDNPRWSPWEGCAGCVYRWNANEGDRQSMRAVTMQGFISQGCYCVMYVFANG